MRRVETACRWLILLLFFFILIFGPLFYGAVEEWQVSILALSSIVIFISWTVSQIVDRRQQTVGRVPSTDYRVLSALLLVLPVLFVLLVILQMTALPDNLLGILSPTRNAVNKLAGIEGSTPVSIAPYTTKLWLFRVIAYSAIFVVGAHALSSRRQVLYILALIVVMGYLIAVYGLLQYLSRYSLPSFFERKYYLDRAAGTYVNPNHFAGYLEMCIPLALSIVFIGKRRAGTEGFPLGRRIINFLSEKLQDRRAILPVSAVVVMSLALVFSMSRMGIFSFAVSLILFALLLGKRHLKRLRLAILGSIVALILALSFWLGLNPVLKRYSVLAGGNLGRAHAWRMTGNVIKDYPVLGTGLGTFAHVSPNYQTHHTKFGHWQESHNDYLNLLSDAGIAGLVIGAGFLLAWYVYVLRLLSKKHLRTYQRSIAAGCIAGVSAILLHSIADFNLQIPANAVYFATLLGLAIAVLRIKEPAAGAHRAAGHSGERRTGSDSDRHPRARLKKAVLCLTAALLGIVVAPMIFGSFLAESWLAKSRSAKDLDGRIQALGNSISEDPGNPEAHYQLGMIEYWDRKNYRKAAGHFLEAVNRAPCAGKHHYRLGLAYSRLGEDILCERELSLAKKFAPMHGNLHFSIGYYHFFKWRRTGDTKPLADAISEFRTAARINGGYLYQALELVAKYLPEYEHLRNLVPDSPGYHHGFANFLAGKARWSEALTEYRKVWRLKLKADPSYRGDCELCLAVSRCYLMTGNTQDAKRGYLKALNLTDDRRRVFHAIRRDYQRAKLLHEGLRLLESLTKRFAYDFALQTEIANCHLALKDYDSAEKLLLELSDIRPSEQIYYQLHNIAMRRKDYNLAEVYAGSAVRLNPSEASHYCLLAKARAANRDYKGAVEALQRATAIDPKNESYKKELDRIRSHMLRENKQPPQ